MSQGENAAEQTKSFFKEGATEGLRQNINSFADNLLSGDKNGTSNTAPASGQKTNHTHDATGSGILGSGQHHTGASTSTTLGGGSNSTTSSGIHPDAQATANEIGKGVNAAGAKIDQALHK